MRWKFAVIICSAILSPAIAQERPSAVSRAAVWLETHDGQTQFQLGDVIRLELVFQDPVFPHSTANARNAWSAPAAGQLTVNTTDYGDIADDVTITPSTGWFQWQGRSGHDYLAEMPLDSRGVRVQVVLNQGYVFREPGHYEVSITTGRMGGTAVSTNSVGIDISRRPAAEEAALVKSLNALITNGDGPEQREAAQRLAYLTGDDAARAKIKWLLSTDQNVARAMVDGLAATKNQALQLQLLREAWSDPAHAPDGTLQWALRRAEGFARGQMERGWTMAAVQKDDKVTRALEADYSEDLDRVIASLPERKGDVLTDTAYYLVEDNKLSPGQLAQVKPVVLQEFSRMEPIAQSMLVETRWDEIKDPSLAPALKAMIDSNARDADAGAAVERLVEIDERAARPYVVKMICRPERGPLLEKLNGVKEDRLPEVDACLTSILVRGEKREHDFNWEQAAQRAARFATPAILPAVRASWTNASQDSSMLALLARDAPKEAVALLDREPNIDWFATNTVYTAVGNKLPEELLVWLRGPKAPRSAFYELAQFGDPNDRLLLEKRLDDLRASWRGRDEEMSAAKPESTAMLAAREEGELVSSLLSARAWTLSDEDKQRIVDGCVSDGCRNLARWVKH
jgi:hypothetical protein